MDQNRSITRRESLKRIAQVSAGLVLAPAVASSILSPDRSHAAPLGKAFLIEGIASKEGYRVSELTRKVVDAAGGMSRFISKGDVVVVKPNLSWARSPELAATTNPEVLQTVIELCQEAGAKRVRIVDHTIHEVRQCFAITGAAEVAQKTGAELVFPRASLMKEVKIRGHQLDSWPVFLPFLEADRIINLPIAKDHGLSTLTLGMKGWIGAVGGRRNALHQDIHQTIVDLAQFFKPTLILIDAIRIMVRNGPSGGSPANVAVKNTLILSDDQVAADSMGARLFGLEPKEIGFIHLAQKAGLGRYDTDVAELVKHRVSL